MVLDDDAACSDIMYTLEDTLKELPSQLFTLEDNDKSGHREGFRLVVQGSVNNYFAALLV